MLHVVRHAIREMLLQERVFGAQAFIYHGSRAEPDVFIDAILNDTFRPGMGSGAMYGKGLYAVHDLEGTATAKGEYGDYIYKLRVNLYGYISFDDDVTSLIYGRAMPPSEQARLVKAPKDVIEALQKYDVPMPDEMFSSVRAHPASKNLKGLVKGLVFTGRHDGRVVVVYDVSTTTPFAWKLAKDSKWTRVDSERVKKSLVKNLSGEFQPEKYDQAKTDVHLALKKLRRMPPNMRIHDGDLLLSGEGITSLPDNLTVNGYLYLDNNPITQLPENLTVNGNLYLQHNAITKIPASLVVNGTLNINGSGVQEIEPGATMNTLSVSDNTTLSTIPDGVNIKFMISIHDSSVASLPQNLSNLESIDIMRSPITAFPSGMRLRYFRIHGSNIQNLPDDLSVTQLELKDTLITELPDSLRVHADLAVVNTPLKKLPNNLILKSLIAVNTDLTELPAGLRVRGHVNVRGSKITSVPDDAEIGDITGLTKQTIDRDAEFASTF